jgi:hypothetical protein
MYSAQNLSTVVFLVFSSIAGAADESQPYSGVPLGTAFFIREDGVMLTNRHVVKNCKSLLVRPENNRSYPASIIAISEDYDLAALRTEGYKPKSIMAVRMTENRFASIPKEGEMFVTGGFSDPVLNNGEISVLDGVAINVEGYDAPESATSIMFSYARPGASGSPVADYAGTLVGIVYAGNYKLSRPLSEPFSKFDTIIKFHNNNAIVDFLTKADIKAYSQVPRNQFIRLEIFGKIINSTALVMCTN